MRPLTKHEESLINKLDNLIQDLTDFRKKVKRRGISYQYVNIHNLDKMSTCHFIHINFFIFFILYKVGNTWIIDVY